MPALAVASTAAAAHAAQLLYVGEVALLVVVVLVLVAAVEEGVVDAESHVLHDEVPPALVVPEAVAPGDDLPEASVPVRDPYLEDVLRELEVRLRAGDAELQVGAWVDHSLGLKFECSGLL